MAYTYILKCNDGSYYTGVTNDIERRLWEHENSKLKGYTLLRRPVKLAWCSEDVPIDIAIQVEKQIKGWRRAKKEALIGDNVEQLPKLATAYKYKDSKSC